MIEHWDVYQTQLQEIIKLQKDLQIIMIIMFFFIGLWITTICIKLGLIATRTYDLVQKVNNIWNQYSRDGWKK